MRCSLLPLVLLTAGLMAACRSVDAPEQPPEIPSAVERGSEAPSFRTVTLAGDTLVLERLRGSVVLLNAWAIWCPPCVEELPALRELHERYQGEGLVVVGLHAGADQVEKAEAFRRLFRISYPNSVERWDRLDGLMGVQRGIPRSALIDRSGRVVKTWIGPVELDRELFEAVLEDRHQLRPDGSLGWRPRS